MPTWEGNKNNKEDIVLYNEQKAPNGMNGDYETIANLYTPDGKIFPDNSKIIEGREAIKKRWILPADTNILLHKIDPAEIKFIVNFAYGY